MQTWCTREQHEGQFLERGHWGNTAEAAGEAGGSPHGHTARVVSAERITGLRFPQAHVDDPQGELYRPLHRVPGLLLSPEQRIPGITQRLLEARVSCLKGKVMVACRQRPDTL